MTKKLFAVFFFMFLLLGCQKEKFVLVDSSIKVDIDSDFEPTLYIEKVNNGEITDVTIEGDVDTSTYGVYEVIYKYEDVEKKLSVEVVDMTAPEVAVKDIKVPQNGTVNIDDIVVSIQDSTEVTKTITNLKDINTKKTGTYKASLQFVDAYGNTTSKEVNVIVEADTVAPVISGAVDKKIMKGATVDLLSGITALDNASGDVTSKIKVTPATIDTSKTGSYQVSYECVDDAGNMASVTITYTIVDNFISTDRGSISGAGLDNKKFGWPISTPLNQAQGFADKGLYYVGDTTTKTYYLTFDVGYENGYTNAILDILKANNIKTIFFLTRPYLISHSDIVNRMIDEGHLIGNHSVTHPSMPSKDDQGIVDEIVGFEKYFYEHYGKKYGQTLKYFRPPMGEYSDRSLSITKQLGYKTIQWNFTFRDWDMTQVPTVQQVRDAFSKMLTQDGTILLLHGVCPTYPAVLDEILKDYVSRGYTFKSLDEMALKLN